MIKKEISIRRRKNTAKFKAYKLVEFALNKKAKNPVILEVKKISNFCDYFIICDGESSTQVRAIYEEVLKKCAENKIEIHHCEDDNSCRWILIDFFDVVLHIFTEETRKFYNLEYLWSEAKKINLPDYLSEKLP